MDGHDGRARSPSVGGVGVPASTSTFANPYDASISPTSAGDQFAFDGQHSYMSNLNAPTFQQTDLSGDFPSK